MGYFLKNSGINKIIKSLEKDYLIYAPVRFVGGGTYSDTDCVRYSQIQKIEDVIFNEKSDYSFKEVLLPISETLFYFTEDSVRESNSEKKGAIIFLRSCDLHAVKRLDEMYLNNGPEDYYYKRIRDKVKFVLMGCNTCFESCFCIDMGTNISTNYDIAINAREDGFEIDSNWEEINEILSQNADKPIVCTADAVTETRVHVSIPENLSQKVMESQMWREYDSRCINCGRCNFVCPTCTCFTMQDIFYTDNGKVGERRRVWASCMVDGYTDVAGGGRYRQKNGDRMRFKVLHKIFDYKERNGYHMCVGCGRCDNICPEYISFSTCVNKLEDAMKEVEQND